ncbi:CaiB/BaiF CoA transferase family protein [Variovorax saccharolyticus]|uniref:CaiB/BaiF CoA transferase family protein n=1 Tax=Variovorax saccharolyticus TaxID=3053516 RepID=UPI00257526E2|nr:CoA transferase [Variovorax sp. J31P216]MDM0030097.1 CoA transferase [Variovorax sp. J31P216]
MTSTDSPESVANPADGAEGRAALPLSGVRIIDLSTVVLGPLATLTLAGLGAEVVKIEAPEGDNVRSAGVMRNEGMGHVFLHGNRGKQSVALDLKQASARDVLIELLGTADVFVTNVRPAALKRLGLDADALRERMPRLIHAVATGYGSGGPYAGKPAYDDLIQGAAGVSWLMQQHVGGEPRYMPVSLADRVTGLHLAYAVTAALYERERTGRGGQVEVPMFECVAHFVLADHLAGETFLPALGGAGYDRLLSENRRPYKTADGHLCVLIYNDAHWQRFLGAIGHAERFTQDARFSSQAARSRHIHEVYGFVGEVMGTRTTHDWVELLDRLDIPNQVPATLDELLEDPHLLATGLLAEEIHPSEGRLRTLGTPTVWPGAPAARLQPASRLGEQGIDVLRAAGFDESRIQQLLDSGALSFN